MDGGGGGRDRRGGDDTSSSSSSFAAFFSFVAGNARVERGPVGELCRVSRLKVGLRELTN